MVYLYHSLIFTLRNLSRYTNLCTPMFLKAELFTMSKLWNQLKCLLLDEWMEEIYIINGVLFDQ